MRVLTQFSVHRRITKIKLGSATFIILFALYLCPLIYKWHNVGFYVFFFWKDVRTRSTEPKNVSVFLCFLQNPVKCKTCVVSKKIERSLKWSGLWNYCISKEQLATRVMMGSLKELATCTEGSEITKNHTQNVFFKLNVIGINGADIWITLLSYHKPRIHMIKLFEANDVWI